MDKKIAKSLQMNNGDLVVFEPPIATEEVVGGILATPASEEDTQEVKIGEDGKLYVKPGNSIDDTVTSTKFGWSSEKTTNEIQNAIENIDLDSKQDTLVSGSNIKTINGEDILGEGNIVIQGGGDVSIDDTTIAIDKTWSSNKINQELENKSGGAVEITQAEYDALPDSKYTNGIIYAVKDAEADVVVPIGSEYDEENEKVTLSGVNSKIAKFESGISDIIPINTDTVFSIRFKETYEKIPNVFVQVLTTSESDWHWNYFSTQVLALTKTGCSVGIHNFAVNSESIRLNWLVVSNDD